MTKRAGLFILVLIIVSVSAFSVPLGNLLTYDVIYRLNENGNFIYQTKFSNLTLDFTPSDTELRQFISEAKGSLNNNILVEALYLHRKDERSHTPPHAWDFTQKTGLYNQLLAISTLEGIQYYSASRGEMRTFFEYSRVIDQPNARNPPPLADPYFSEPPANYSLYARQKDLTFGDNVYRYTYRNARDGIFFVQENVSALTIGIIPAVGRGNLKSIFAVFDCGDTLLIYNVTFARALSISSLSERIGASFSNRAEAVIKWFTGRADIILSSY